MCLRLPPKNRAKKDPADVHSSYSCNSVHSWADSIRAIPYLSAWPIPRRRWTSTRSGFHREGQSKQNRRSSQSRPGQRRTPAPSCRPCKTERLEKPSKEKTSCKIPREFLCCEAASKWRGDFANHLAIISAIYLLIYHSLLSSLLLLFTILARKIARISEKLLHMEAASGGKYT